MNESVLDFQDRNVTRVVYNHEHNENKVWHRKYFLLSV